MSILNWIEKIKRENEGPRITAQKPRTMAQAPIAEDLEPGALRDEMLKGFDPSQETHEEYLQRINLERPFNMAEGGRTPFSYAGVVKQGPQTGMHKYLDFYTKKQAKDLGRGTATAEWFKTKKAMNAALEKRKLETGRGLTDAELTKKHKKELTKRGYNTWGEAPDKVKRAITVATSAGPYESQAKWKKEGLKTKISEKTRKLLAEKKPINQRTGLPYTLKEFSALTSGQKEKLTNRLKGKVAPRPWAKRQGWYPEKQANKLMTYLKHAAKKQESLPLKERNFINVWEGEKFVGVKDKRKNTLWTHVDYDLTGKKGTVITKHPSHKNIQFFLKQAEKFKYGAPDELLGSYFSKYQRVPKYSEMYTFFTVDPQSVGAKSGKAYKFNPLQQHHQELIGKEPAKSIQLTLQKQNTEASRILNQFEKGAKGYSFAEADKKLKELGVRIKGSKGWMGPAKAEITAAKSIEAAQAETVKMFKEAYKNNPKIVDQMTKALNIAKTAKGPGKLKALGTLITLGGAGFVTALGFNPKEVQAAGAQAGETGVIDKAKSFPIEHPWLTAGAATGASKFTKADPLKYFRKVPRKIFSSFGTPTGALAAWPLAAMGMKKAGLMEEDAPAFDIKSTADRIGAEAELALAPSLVKWTDKFTKPIKNQAVRSGVTRLLNLGMSPTMALRAARIASPIGIGSLILEGSIKSAKDTMATAEQIDAIQDQDLQRQEYDNLIRNIVGYAGGGMVGIRKPNAIAPTGGPMSQGLRSLYINDKDY